MKMINLLILICAFFQLGCEEDKIENERLIGKWELIEIKEKINLEKWDILFSNDTNCSIELQFLNTHKFNAKTCRNQFNGNYELRNSNLKTIKISNLGGTKVNEDSWGNKFIELLPNSKSYNIKLDTLFIKSSDFILTLTLKNQ